MRRSGPAVLMLVALLPGAAVARRCVINGEEVNPDNGSTTAGKTGILTCWHDDGSKMYEHELRDGVHLGLDRSYGFDGGMRERQVNANGNSEGLAREYYRGGQIKSEGTYSNGDAVGLATTYHLDGQLATLRFHPKAGDRAAVTIEYDSDGRLRDLGCAAQSFIPEDRALCGFAGDSVEVALHGQGGRVVEKRTLRNGRVLRAEGYDAAGKRTESMETTGHGRIARRYFDNGQVASESVVEGDRAVRETEWYMNGALKTRTVTEPAERDAKVVVERFRDTGVLQQREERRGRDPVLREQFDEQGARSEEFVYADEGHVRLHRKFAPDGKVLLEEELYPDGSRKVLQQVAD